MATNAPLILPGSSLGQIPIKSSGSRERSEADAQENGHVPRLTSSVASTDQLGNLKSILQSWYPCKNNFVESRSQILQRFHLAKMERKADEPYSSFDFPPEDQSWLLSSKADDVSEMLELPTNWHRLSLYYRVVSVEQVLTPAPDIYTFMLQTERGMDTDCDHYGPPDPPLEGVTQGGLKNGYFVEALNALSLRPWLVRRIFVDLDPKLGLYAMQLYRNGQWTTALIDDYFPFDRKGRFISCRPPLSFPSGTGSCWAPLVEKMYAKTNKSWEALSSRGDGLCRVEEALTDLTGGVCSRFSAKDVATDRLFLYLHELQHSTLFVLRPDIKACRRRGIPLPTALPYAIHRVAEFDGGQYLHILCGGSVNPGAAFAADSLPLSLEHRHEPFFVTSDGERGGGADGFFWISIEDFKMLFNVVIECRLIITEPEWALWNKTCKIDENASRQHSSSGSSLGPTLCLLPPTSRPLVPYPVRKPPPPDKYHEANMAVSSPIDEANCPSFFLKVNASQPIEVFVQMMQVDKRFKIDPQTGEREKPAALLLRVFERVGVGAYALVARQGEWIRSRDSAVVFKSLGGNSFSIVYLIKATLPPNSGQVCDRLILRCYSSPKPVELTLMPPSEPFTIVQPDQALSAIPFSLSCAGQELTETEEVDPEEGIGTPWAVHVINEQRQKALACDQEEETSCGIM